MKKFLVVRNDKIGDFMLAWPAIALLKQSCACHITALVPAYTAPLADLCPWIDHVIIDPGKEAPLAEQKALRDQLYMQHFHASLCLFTNARNAYLLNAAKIRHRYAPATGTTFILHNHVLRQRRSQSIKPEFVYNLELAQFMLKDWSTRVVETKVPFLDFPVQTSLDVRHQVAQELGCTFLADWVMIHVGQGGSAPCWPLEHYQWMAWMLWQAYPEVKIIFTALPHEQEMAQKVCDWIRDQECPAFVYVSQQGLDYFAQVVSCAQIFIAGSTGPLHIAGALDIPTVGFYSRKRSASALRWQTLNSPARRLSFMPPESVHQLDMAAIDPSLVLQQLVPWALDFLSSPTKLHIWQKLNVPITDSIRSQIAHQESLA